MTAPARHTKREIVAAAEAAKRFGVRVRLLDDGTIEFDPEIDTPEKKGRLREPKL